jgi:arsenite-transporting ATPase
MLVALLLVTAAAIWIPDTSAFSTARHAFENNPTVSSFSPQHLSTRTLSNARLLPQLSPTKTSSTSLFSLKPLLSEIESQIASNTGETPVVFVGGKGGVGKTSISSSLAVALASSIENEYKVLIVSTDPAHSLGDALDVDLRQRNIGTRPKPVMLTDPLTNGKLHALEVDPNAALEEFQSNLQLFDVSTLSQSLGINVSPQMLTDLGLDELHTLIRNPPPGLDELVALANVLDPKFSDEYDVIIVDTAPTGHTLRMLALPQFLDGFLGTLLKLREKLKGLIQTVQMFIGGTSEVSGGNIDVDQALGKLEEFQSRTSKLRQRLKNAATTKFVVVTIPTVLSVRESQRLMQELGEQGVCVSDVVVNQCIGGGNGNGASDMMKIYYERRVSGQQRWISELKDACADVSNSEEYRSNVGEGSSCSGDIVVKEVPYYDVELVGVPALGFLGSITFSDPSFKRLIGFEEENDGPKVVICGGKGGVGKTTTSSSLAISMAMGGHNVAIVSTDPAHSLGDALDMNLQGGSLLDVSLIGVPPMVTDSSSEGSLKAMEIDPTSALKEFRDSIDQLIGKSNNGDNSELFSTLSSVGELLDTLPAGTDEVVALAKVIQLIRRGQFDRVVLDTAPTGHTLRMLTTPSFLADLIERVLNVSRKLNSNAAVKVLLASAKNKYDVDDAAEQAKSALLKFQVSMYDLEDLFADPASTEFLIVTIASELAVRESTRLLNDLTFGDPDMPIRVRSVVVNQVLEESKVAEAFMSQVARTQSSCIDQVRTSIDQKSPRITEVSYLDTEPRGVYGLKALSEEYLTEKVEIS